MAPGQWLYDMRCGFTGTQVRFLWDIARATFGLWMMRDTRTREKTGSTIRRRMVSQHLALDVQAAPVDLLTYCHAGLLRWPFKAWCPAIEHGNRASEWHLIFRTLKPDKYPAHCLVVQLEPAGENNNFPEDMKPYFFLTPLDVIRVRDAFYRQMEQYEGEGIIDSIVIRYPKDGVPGIRVSGGREVPLTRMAVERLLHTMTEIVTMHIAQKKRDIGVRHGALGVTNQVTKRFAVVSVSVAGWSIPLDWMNTMRFYMHLSLVSQKLCHEQAELFGFDFDFGGTDGRSDCQDCAQVQVL